MPAEMRICLFAFLFWFASLLSSGQTFLRPDHPDIRYTGAFFSDRSDSLVVFLRHSPSFLSLPPHVSLASAAKARTTTGVTVSLRTGAEGVKAWFRMMKGQNRRMFSFTCYVDGDSTALLKQKRDLLTEEGDSLFALVLPVPGDGAVHTYRLVLPVLSTPAFAGITLTGEHASLQQLPPADKPLYLAYGNSITHGQGQFTGDQTWPWVLAGQMGWELCNLAVGGSKTSLPMARMIAREITRPVDYMTILIGFNDAVFLMIDTATYRRRLTAFIKTVRRGHPETEIFLLGQTYTEKKKDKAGNPLHFDEWRKVQREVAESFVAGGDGKIHFINGAGLTDHADLKNPPRDVVHLSVAGAARFGKSLADTIRTILDNTPGDHGR